MRSKLKIGIVFLTMSLFCSAFIKWSKNFETATTYAKQNKKLVLLNFSGSDWCGPCMRLRKEILDHPLFTKLADSVLVLVNADFPRNKKNQLDANTTKNNELLAEKYNPDGHFPYTVLLNSDGKVLQTWDGYPKENIEELSQAILSQYRQSYFGK